MLRKKTKNYISELDVFLHGYNKTHPKSEAQLAEIQKYQRVFALRDNPIADTIPEDEFFS